MLAGLQDEVRSQSTVGAVRTVNKPTAFYGAEEGYSDWEFGADVLHGNDGRHVVDRAASGGSKPKSEEIPTDEAGNERAGTLQYPGIADDEGPRKMVREVPYQNGYEAY